MFRHVHRAAGLENEEEADSSLYASRVVLED
jgi:hypothetical protein